MRKLSLALALIFLLPFGAGAAEPTNLEELDEALDVLTERLVEIKTLAARDERWRVLEAYARKSEEDFRKRREPRAEDVLDVMIAADAPPELREAAKKHLLDVTATTLDPDLIDRKDPTRSRTAFAKRHVVRHLSDKDEATRVLVHDLLLQLFPAAKRDIDIRSFDPLTESRAERKKAERAWQAFLRR